MGEDLSTGIKMAIILVILAALLASVFSILTITKNMTNQSVDELQSSLYAFQNMRWEDYNLRTISGNEVQVVVRSAVDNNIAVVVNTQRNHSMSVLYGLPIEGFDKAADGRAYWIKSLGTSDSSAISQYCESVTDGKLYFDTKNSYFVGTRIDENSEEYMLGSYVRNINDNSSSFYVDPSLKFNSYIIRDESGSLLGILFDQK